MDGLPVLELLRPCDGLPPYSNGGPGQYVGEESFRAQFLKDCIDIIGNELWDRCYEDMDADAARQFADALHAKADAFARANGLDLDALPVDVPEDLDSNLSRLHVLRAAIHWCKFWSQRGHGIAPWF